MSQQLVKKGANGKYSNVNPKSWTEAIKDKNTGQNLVEILQGFNMYFLSYTGDKESTRCLVPNLLRKKGLWITYVDYDGIVYTEWYAANSIKDDSWEDSSNWRDGSNMLVGDISISSNGNWVINGVETNHKATGERGYTPILRVGDNNKLQASYDGGYNFSDISQNSVFTQFAIIGNKLNISDDLGKTWKPISEYIASWFRVKDNKLEISRDNTTWSAISEPIASWFRWEATEADSQANNLGRLQISRDNRTWDTLSGDIINNLHISKYIGADDTLPTTGIPEGTIYAKGPTYAEDDTLNENPIYRLWVYAWKDDVLAWVDNGEFTSIAAGIVQEMGDSETELMSQKAITEFIRQLGYFIENPEFIKVIVDKNNRIIESINTEGDKTIYGNLEVKKRIRGYIQEVVGKSLINSLFADSLSYIENEEWLKTWQDSNGRIVLGITSKGEVVLPKLKLDRQFLTRLEEALLKDGFNTGEDVSAQVSTNTKNISSLTSKVNTLEGNINDVKEDSVEAAIEAANEVANQPIDGSTFTEGLWQQINAAGGGTVNNAADEEDLTVKKLSNGVSVLKFANKNYAPSVYSGLGHIILRKNVINGKNILDTSIFNSITDTTFIVQYDFDLNGQTLTLGAKNKLLFKGGSIKNGIITLEVSNEFISEGQYQCFYDVSFKGTYSKTLPLSMLGVIADGKDKYPILSKLPDLLVEYNEEATAARNPVFSRVSIDGTIRCETNEFNLPGRVSMYGINNATINFTSDVGEYCMSISNSCALNNITLKNAKTTYNGVILLSSTAIHDFSRNLYGASELTLNNVTITGPAWVSAEECNAVGFKIVASAKDNVPFYYYTHVKLNNVDIEFVNVGLDLVIDNYSRTDGAFAWGNEVNADTLYILASNVGIRQRTYENGTSVKIQDSGYMCFNNYEFQARSASAVGFDIQTTQQTTFLRYMSWDSTCWGIVRDNASVRVLYDGSMSESLTTSTATDSNSVSYLSAKVGIASKEYKIYKGKLDRRLSIYNN